MRRAALADLEQCAHALDAIATAPEANVHLVRKRAKRLRALLRLARDMMGERDYRRANALVRDGARELASAREAAVRRHGLELLLAALPGLDAAFVQSLRTELGVAGSEHAPPARAVDEARAAFQSVSRAFEALHGSENWSAIAPGLRRSYRRGRRLMRAGLRTPTTHGLHQWRKWVKYQWHQVELLAPLWPEDLQTRALRLKHLADLLGDEHDLADLRESLLASPHTRSQPAIAARMLGAIDERRRLLRKDALQIGTRLFAEDARAFEQRLGRYYRAFVQQQHADLDALDSAESALDSAEATLDSSAVYPPETSSPKVALDAAEPALDATEPALDAPEGALDSHDYKRSTTA